MKHFFMEIDGMTVTYGDIVKGRLCDTVPYYVERDDGEGDFDFAQGSLPTCTPVKSKGFAESELWDIESLMSVVLDHFGYWDFSYNLSCLNSRRKRRSSYGHQG